MEDKNLKELEEQVRSIMNTRNAKTFNFGRLYNMSAGDLLKLLDLEGK